MTRLRDKSRPCLLLLGVAMVLLSAACQPAPTPSSVARSVNETSFEVPPGGATTQATGTAGGSVIRTRDGSRTSEIIPGQPVEPAFTGTSGVQRSVNGVEVNFDGADVKEVVREVLGEILEVPYTIDDGVAGPVIMSTAGPVSEGDLLLLLETALRMVGASMVADGGGGFIIVSEADAIGRTDVLPLGGRPVATSPGVGATVVPLRFVDAATAAQFIQPIVGNPDTIRVDNERNLLLFTGSGPERRAVLDTIQAIDVDWLAGRSVGIFTLAIATPESLVPELEALFLRDVAAENERLPVQFLPVSRLNAILAVARSPQQLREVERWISRLDRGRDGDPQFYVYGLKHAPARDVAEILRATFSDDDATRFDDEPPTAGLFGQPGSLADQIALDEDGLPLGPEPPQLNDALDSSLGSDDSLPGGTRIVANERDNSVIVRTTPRLWEIIEDTLRRLDTAPEQVLIEATIAEVELNDALRYGVQYFINAGNTRIGFNNSVESPGFRGPNNLDPLAQVPGFNFIFTGGSSNITIDALSRVTEVRVLSSPSVVVEENNVALLSVGDSIPISTRTSQSVSDADAPLLSNIEYRDTGVILQVRPRINSDDYVNLEVGQEVSRVTSPGTNELQPTPTIQQRKITSQVNVDSGQTVVLGGLIQEDEQRNRDRVPLLGDLPVVGGLFGSTSNSASRSELIVFLTPRVIRNAEDARDISVELRDRMKALRARDLGGAFNDEVLPGRPGLGPLLPTRNEPAAPAPAPANEPQTLAPVGSLEPALPAERQIGRDEATPPIDAVASAASGTERRPVAIRDPFLPMPPRPRPVDIAILNRLEPPAPRPVQDAPEPATTRLAAI